MKVANASSNKPSKKVKCIIPLKCDEAHHKLTKENSVLWELRTVPTQADSPTHEVPVRVLSGDESVQQMLRWRKDIDEVCTGVNATDLASKKPIMLAHAHLHATTGCVLVRSKPHRPCHHCLQRSSGH